MKEEPWRRNHGGIIEETPTRHPQAPRGHPGGTREAPRRHPGGTQGHPGGTQEARGAFERIVPTHMCFVSKSCPVDLFAQTGATRPSPFAAPARLKVVGRRSRIRRFTDNRFPRITARTPTAEAVWGKC